MPSTYCVKHNHAGIAFTGSKNMFFTSQRRHIALILVKFGMLPSFMFIWGRNVGIQPQNCQNFEFCPQICPSGANCLHNFYRILSVCTHQQVYSKVLICSISGDKQPCCKYLLMVGEFSYKFSIAPSGKTTDRIKKS